MIRYSVVRIHPPLSHITQRAAVVQRLRRGIVGPDTRVRFPPAAAVGKRSNPIGLRLGFSENWRIGLPAVSRLRYARHGIGAALRLLAHQFLGRRGIRLFWSVL